MTAATTVRVDVPALPVRCDLFIDGAAAGPGESVLVDPGETVVELRLRGGGAVWFVSGTATLPLHLPPGAQARLRLPGAYWLKTIAV